MGYATRTAPGGTAQHMAEQCKDETCPRLPCRMFKAGYEEGYRKGWDEGYAAGYGAGFSAGYSAGFSAGFSAGSASTGS